MGLRWRSSGFAPLAGGLIAALVYGVVSASVPALAGPVEGKTCAEGLSTQARLIYEAAAPEVKPGEKPAGVIRDKTRALVMSGKIPREVAQARAEEAGACLLKLQAAP